MTRTLPARRPANPCFSSGPCAKRPGWSLDALGDAPLGRSHRAPVGRAKLARAIDLTRAVLEVPAAHRIGMRALKNRWMWAIAAAVFVAIFGFDTPFPATVLAAGSVGHRQ